MFNRHHKHFAPLGRAVVFLLSFAGIAMAETKAAPSYLAKAKEVTDAIHSEFWIPQRSLYLTKPGSNDPETVWGCGVLFSMLTAAARHEPQTYQQDLLKFYEGLDEYWDKDVKIPGYEPCPTKGGGEDKYYDDNAWMVLTFAEAYQVTGRHKMIRRSYDTLEFVMSGWDDTLGGGIWWHEKHKDGTKNTCINAPAAVACLTLAKYRPDRRKKLVEKASELVAWTRKNLQAEDGLYMDSIKADTGKINTVKLTYNSALMLRAELMLYKATGDKAHLIEAERIGAAANHLCFDGTSIYRDPPRWSHLMVEADLELNRATGDKPALARAQATTDSSYNRWKSGKVSSLIDISSIARALWLMADSETEVGQKFWKSMDELQR
jgi:hypothetical protein